MYIPWTSSTLSDALSASAKIGTAPHLQEVVERVRPALPGAADGQPHLFAQQPVQSLLRGAGVAQQPRGGSEGSHGSHGSGRPFLRRGRFFAPPPPENQQKGAPGQQKPGVVPAGAAQPQAMAHEQAVDLANGGPLKRKDFHGMGWACLKTSQDRGWMASLFSCSTRPEKNSFKANTLFATKRVCIPVPEASPLQSRHLWQSLPAQGETTWLNRVPLAPLSILLQMAMDQKPNCTPSEHPNPTTKIGSKIGGEFTYPKMVPLVLTHSQITKRNPSSVQGMAPRQFGAIISLHCGYLAARREGSTFTAKGLLSLEHAHTHNFVQLAGAQQGMRNGMTLINHPTGGFL